LLDDALNMLRLEEVTDNDLINYLKEEIIKWACTLGHPVCITIAYHTLHRYLQTFEKYP